MYFTDIGDEYAAIADTYVINVRGHRRHIRY